MKESKKWWSEGEPEERCYTRALAGSDKVERWGRFVQWLRSYYPDVHDRVIVDFVK